MPGTFDELIKQAMMTAGPRSQEAGINPRDIAARRMNIAQRGVNSTAMPPPQMMNAQPQPPQLPASGPAVPSRPMDEAIAAQAGEGMPTPTARPNPEAMEMGDASVMEAMADSPMMQQIAAQAGEPAAPPVEAPIAEAPAQAGGAEAITPSIIAAIVASGGAAALLQRYRMGDPDAARTFQAIGISPQELEMFSGQVAPERSRGTYTGGSADESGKQDRPQRKGGTESKAKPKAQSKDASSSSGKAGADDDYKGAKAPDWYERMNKKPRVKVKAK